MFTILRGLRRGSLAPSGKEIQRDAHKGKISSTGFDSLPSSNEPICATEHSEDCEPAYVSKNLATTEWEYDKSRLLGRSSRQPVCLKRRRSALRLGWAGDSAVLMDASTKTSGIERMSTYDTQR